MKNIIAAVCIVITLIIVFSCEKDDFCIENPVTPRLILRFYNKHPDSLALTKTVQQLSIIGLGVADSIVVSSSLDSIAIPLNAYTNETKFLLKKAPDSINLYDTLFVKYSTDEKYVSRSCGYRVFFNTVTFNHEGAWIDSLSYSNSLTINSESSAHVKIFH